MLAVLSNECGHRKKCQQWQVPGFLPVVFALQSISLEVSAPRSASTTSLRSDTGFKVTTPPTSQPTSHALCFFSHHFSQSTMAFIPMLLFSLLPNVNPMMIGAHVLLPMMEIWPLQQTRCRKDSRDVPTKTSMLPMRSQLQPNYLYSTHCSASDMVGKCNRLEICDLFPHGPYLALIALETPDFSKSSIEMDIYEAETFSSKTSIGSPEGSCCVNTSVHPASSPAPACPSSNPLCAAGATSATLDFCSSL